MNDPQATRTARELARILFQHWAKIFIIVVLLTGGTFVFCGYWATPIYRSEVSVMFKRPRNDNPASVDSQENALEVFVKAQQQIVMSDLVMARAKVIAQDAELRRRWFTLRDALRQAQSVGGDIAAVQTRIDDFVRKGAVATETEALLTGKQDTLTKFGKSVDLETPGGERVAMTESFTIRVDRPGSKRQAESYKNAMYAADLVADMYMVRHRQLQEALNEPAGRVMQNIVQAVDHDVERLRSAYADFVRDNAGDIGVLEQLIKSGSEHGVQIILTRIRESDAALYLKLVRARAIRDVIRSDLPPEALESGGIDKMADAAVAAVVDNISAELLGDNAVVLSMKEKVAALEAKRANLRTQFTDDSRDVRYIEQEIRAVQRQLLRAVVAHARGLHVTIKALEEEQAGNRELLEKTAREQSRITSKLATYVRLKNDLKVAEMQLARLKEQRVTAEANSLRAREAVTITKLNPASVPDPDKPVSPRTLLYTAVALVVSLLMGLAIAFLADHFDHTLRSTDEAESYLDVPVLGSVKRYGGGIVVS